MSCCCGSLSKLMYNNINIQQQKTVLNDLLLIESLNLVYLEFGRAQSSQDKNREIQ